MKKVTGYLQNPYLKIFAAPFAPIAFGIIAGIYTSNNPNIMQAVLLYLILFLAHIINHFQHQKFIVKNTKATPNSLLYGSIILMVVLSILFMISQHWIINLLMVLYVLFILLQYIPFQMAGTIYHYLLNVFFNGFLLNTIAYFSQTNGITPEILQAFIPIVLFYAGSELIQYYLNGHLNIYQSFQFIKKHVHLISFIAMAAGIAAGVYMSLPSRSFFIIQIIYTFMTLFLSIPTLVKVKHTYKVQNKINYNSALALLFCLLYSLSFLF